MKTLIISDLHLGSKLEVSKYQYLEKIISQADRVIIVGDFWEGYLISFDEFLKSEWKGLFHLLLKKHTVYLNGNHDPAYWCNEGFRKFATAMQSDFEWSENNHNFVLRHGHLELPIAQGPFARLLSKSKHIVRAALWVETALVGLLGDYYFRYLVLIGANKKTQVWRKKYLGNNVMLVCGHTHVQQGQLQEGYANLGMFKNGYAQYAWVQDGELTLVNDRY